MFGIYPSQYSGGSVDVRLMGELSIRNEVHIINKQ